MVGSKILKETRWFLGEDSSRVFAVYRAQFEGAMITDEVQWSLPSGDTWVPTRRVSDWYWIGLETVWPCDQAKAEEYLPKSAFDLP